MGGKFYVGIDLGGMSAKAGLFDAEGTMLAKESVKAAKDVG